MKEKVLFNWSGGKDSALCLYKLLQIQEYEIACLLTSISQPYQRISMHGVRVALLEAQAARIGLPLVKMELPEAPTMETYEAVMTATVSPLLEQGITTSVFGDIFLEDLRQYRESKLAESGLKGLFPLWKIPTGLLIREFIALGFKTIVTCVNDHYLDKSFAGRIIDEAFLKELPDTVDPCGENGEFHTFVFDGPIFSEPIRFEKGELVYKTYPAPKSENQDSDEPVLQNGFWYCDLLPVTD